MIDKIVLPDYPYRNKFTNEQVREALDRKDRLVELMMDPVGPNGTLMNLPIDMIHILAFHLAYAGADAHTDERQLIESRVRRDETAMFEVYEWRPKGDFEESKPESDPASEAAVVVANMKAQLTPEVRAALAEIMVGEYQRAVSDQNGKLDP